MGYVTFDVSLELLGELLGLSEPDRVHTVGGFDGRTVSLTVATPTVEGTWRSSPTVTADGWDWHVGEAG